MVARMDELRAAIIAEAARFASGGSDAIFYAKLAWEMLQAVETPEQAQALLGDLYALQADLEQVCPKHVLQLPVLKLFLAAEAAYRLQSSDSAFGLPHALFFDARVEHARGLLDRDEDVGVEALCALAGRRDGHVRAGVQYQIISHGDVVAGVSEHGLPLSNPDASITLAWADVAVINTWPRFVNFIHV